MPTLITPKRGTRNQRKGSCVPSMRSLTLKSTDFWDVPVRKLSHPRVNDPCEAFDSETAKKVSAMKMKGSDVRRHTSILSEKDMNTPTKHVSAEAPAGWWLFYIPVAS